MVRLNKFIMILVFIIGTLILSACGVVEVGVEQPLVIPNTMTAAEPQVETLTKAAPNTVAPAESLMPAVSQSTTVEAPPSTAIPHSPLWTQYRDPRFGYGLALPCYWNIYPTDKDYDGSPSISSYDEAFFFANATKGQWNDGVWPEGAVKFNAFVSEAFDPALSLKEAVQQVLNNNDFGTVKSLDEVTLGANTAMQLTREDQGDPNLPDRGYFFRFSPDRLLYLSVNPRQALETADVQNVLTSLAFTPQDQIAIPSTPPSGPVEGREIYLDEQAGYCFSYPSEANIDSNLPSQSTFVGKVASLKLERPLYDISMAIDVQKVSESISLQELVNRFLQQYSGSENATITDYVPKVSGEAAKVIENVPGREGGRDLFTLHDGKLLHLFIRPSSTEFTQASADLEYLFQVITSSLTFIL